MKGKNLLKKEKEISTMYNSSVRSKNTQKGITLVALVVTIVVLLILAGITISTLFSDNGIIKRAQQAKQATEEAEKTTQSELNNLVDQLKELTGDGGISAADIANATDKSVYYGKTVDYVVSNYQVNDTTSLQQYLENEEIKWQIFYSDSSNIYLIASDYIHYDICPSSATQTIYKNSDYCLSMDNVISDYVGSASITDQKLQALNSSYYKLLSDSSTNSTNNNMKAVAYMMDTNVWSRFTGENAEYAIGGPTVEMLMKSYSEYKGDIKDGTYGYGAYAYSSTTGYIVTWNYGASKDINFSDSTYYLDHSSDNMYVKTSQSKAYAYWVASPPASNTDGVMYVAYDGSVDANYYYYSNPGFRPLVSLKSEVLLEAVEDADGNVTSYTIK